MTQPIRILVVEDAEADYLLIVRSLRTQDLVIESGRVDSAQGLREALSRERWDLVISDCRLPGFTATEALALCRGLVDDIPFIATSGVLEEEQAVSLLKAGAHDFVSKSNFSRLGPAIRRELREAEERRRRRRAERALRQSETRFQTLAVHSPTGIFQTDEEGRVAYLNPAWYRITGMQEGEGLGSGWVRALHPEDREWVANSWFLAVSRREQFQMEFRFLRSENNEVWVVAQGSPHLDDDGCLMGYVGTITDITDYKRIQTRLQESTRAAQSASRSKSEFLTSMSHEIRTPMNVVIGMGDLLLETELDDVQRGYVLKLQESGSNLLELINQILDLSKIEAGQLPIVEEPVDLERLLCEVAGLFEAMAAGKGIALECLYDEKLPAWVMGDKLRLRQILFNLMGNALKFTESGTITLASEVDPESSGKMRLAVTDTGIGIPREQSEKIFSAFTQVDSSLTRRYGGTGLGLTISKRLVEAMDGRIWVDSREGIGSAFHITLPLRPAAPPPQSVPPEAAVVRSEDEIPLRILLVEDSEDNQLLMCTYLKKAPHQVEIAANGEEAVRRVRKESFDLVLMDIQMPIMDGYTATRHIRRWEAETLRPPLPIIALSANALEGEVDRSREAGCSLYLSKPIKKQRLVEAIRQVAGRAGPRDG
ncbi:MAG: response regulator [Magnetococcales bacterium]|nr:response regulator [Magnetococcales bacterium]